MGYRVTPSDSLLALRKKLQDSLGATDETPYTQDAAPEADPEKLPSGMDVQRAPSMDELAPPAEDEPQAPPQAEKADVPDLFPKLTSQGGDKPESEADYLPTKEDINSYMDKRNRGNFVNSFSRIFGGGPEADLVRKKALLDNFHEREAAQNRERLANPDSMESKLGRVASFRKLSELRDLASQKGDTQAFQYYDDMLKQLPKMSAGQLTTLQSAGGRKPSKTDDLLDFGDKDALAERRADTAASNAETAKKRAGDYGRMVDIRGDNLSLGINKQVNFNPVSTQLQKQKVRINAALERLNKGGVLDESALSDIEADYAAALAGTGVFSNYKLQQLKQPSLQRDFAKMRRYFGNGPIDLRGVSPDIVAQVKGNLMNLSKAYDDELGRVSQINNSMHFKTKQAQDTLKDSVNQYQKGGGQKTGNVDGQNIDQVRAWVSDPANAKHPNYQKWKGWLDAHGG